MSKTIIHIEIDGRDWTQELPGSASDEQVRLAIRDVTDAYPVFTRKYITITRTSWLYRHLAPIADGWLALNPAVRWGLYSVGCALFGIAVYLNV